MSDQENDNQVEEDHRTEHPGSRPGDGFRLCPGGDTDTGDRLCTQATGACRRSVLASPVPVNAVPGHVATVDTGRVPPTRLLGLVGADNLNFSAARLNLKCVVL